jgi:glycosidase
MELAVLLQATLPGAPCVYYGDEVGITGGKDPESRKAFPWDPARWEPDLLDATRASFALRRAEPALRSDGVAFLTMAGQALAFERRDGERRLAVAINSGETEASLALGATGGDAAVLLLTGRARLGMPQLVVSDGQVTMALPPRAGAVVRLS